MCVRYVGFDLKIQRVRERFPGDLGDFYVLGGETREGSWGIQPSWAKTADFGRKNAYNARAETVAEKPTFRAAFKARRCVVPITGFYERANGRWMLVEPVDTDPFLIAGLFEEPNHWSEHPSFTMVTTEPNSIIEEVQDRMPVILSEVNVDCWLDPVSELAQLAPLMVPCSSLLTRIQDAGPIRPAKPVVNASLFDL